MLIMNPKVNIFVGYREDNRKSMEIYANRLFNNFPIDEQLEIELYQPKKLMWNKYLPSRFSIKTRISRYIDYPAKLISERVNFSHIIDHTYAHLASVLNPRRCIVTVHDLIPLLAWKGQVSNLSLSHKPILFMYSSYFLRKVEKIIAVSYSTKSDLVCMLGIPEEKITVIHNGVDVAFQPLLNRDSIKQELNLNENGVFNILIIGNSDYKNNKTALGVIELFESRHGLTVQLICLGNDQIKFEKDCLNFKLKRVPRFIMNIGMLELVRLYNSCDCLLFPSLYEGFGFPTLEAMACGLPVVSSNSGAIVEIVGDAALTSEPNNIQELTNHLFKVLTDRGVRDNLIFRGLVRAKNFSWNKAAQKTLNLYKETWGI